MNRVSFSTKSVNNNLNSEIKYEKNQSNSLYEFKCNKANNKIYLTPKAKVLGKKVSLWK